MKFCLSPTGIKKFATSNSAAGAGKTVAAAAPVTTLRGRFSNRSVLPVVLLLAILSPFLFVRLAFLVLDSSSRCASAIDCVGWRLFSGIDPSQKLREELSRALVEAADDNSFEDGMESSFNELVQGITAKRQDVRAFASKTKSMLLTMEHKVQSARNRELIFWHLASLGVPKSLHCLSLKLAEEYTVNALARSRLPPPELVSRLSDPSFNHVVLLTDNVLAASVVVSSTVENAANPEKLVFHIVTDRKTYTPMHAWFAINSFNSAVVEVRGLHQYEWSQEVNIGVKQMLEMHRLIWGHHYKILKEGYGYVRELNKACLEALHPSCLSLMNHLRIYIPELFPDLNKVVFLDDDVVVQHDLSTLWTMDLNGKVAGAVFDSWCGDNCCPGRKYKDYFNFSQPIVSENFDPDRCAWLYGMNIFDFETWRSKNITATYHEWLRYNLNSGLTLWQPGSLPPALAAFKDHVHAIDPLWHVSGLGYRSLDTTGKGMLEAAAVIHFSGPAKPWLEIGFSDAQRLWMKHINFSDAFIRTCRILG